MPAGWAVDVLGDDFRSLTIPLPDDDEGDVVATLVRHDPGLVGVRPARAVLYLHGWSDYFFQTGLAEFWTAQGVAFYALDLRKYGRSLREHQTPGYVEHLSTYDEDIEAALDVIHTELGPHCAILLTAHSTGGLVAALWAARNPGQITGLALNSPWLELQGSSIARTVSTPAVAQIARFHPRSPLPNIDPGFYARVVDAHSGGAWTTDPRWRPNPSFPVRAGWLRAILAGHAIVAAGLSIDVPVLVCLSARTHINPRWSEDMRGADIVLDVETIARRVSSLGPTVTLVRIPGGIHDLTLSPPEPRARYYTQVMRWSLAYGWG
ncbi:alpha/beta hydrolase [Sanguibacter sp. A247]|uniref:alpha/beta hydrolase n=1 Tax=unclassified Sanguibacter TaxID=2645534 RepID=UPI003FD77B2C